MILEELIRKKVSTDFWQPHRGRWFKKKKTLIKFCQVRISNKAPQVELGFPRASS